MFTHGTIPELDARAADEARERQDQLTKPRGSLGRLERLAIELAAVQGGAPRSRPAAAIVFAADHPGGVSAYPREVTAAMVRNFASGGAACSVLSRALDVPLHVVDVGVDTPYDALEGHVREHVPGGDLARGEAMTSAARAAAMTSGARAVDRAGELRLLLLGEMGIGNTTAASALAGALLGVSAHDIVGPGTGVEGEALARKREVVDRAIACVRGASPLDVITRVSGREIAALTAAILRAAERRVAVLVDGFIVSAAALAAVRIAPSVRPFLLFAHRSAEPGHARVLDALHAEPLLDLGMRLGEASGALVALPIVDAACALHARMATFAEAAVPDRA